MAIKIGINGFGRIGRVILPERTEKCSVEHPPKRTRMVFMG